MWRHSQLGAQIEIVKCYAFGNGMQYCTECKSRQAATSACWYAFLNVILPLLGRAAIIVSSRNQYIKASRSSVGLFSRPSRQGDHILLA